MKTNPRALVRGHGRECIVKCPVTIQQEFLVASASLRVRNPVPDGVSISAVPAQARQSKVCSTDHQPFDDASLAT